VKALLALLLVACSGGTHAPPATLKGSAEPPVAERATPAPSITFADDQFELHGFPAIAKDRSVVALPVIESDGGRGYPNLRIELRFDSDKTFETIPVMISSDYEAFVINTTWEIRYVNGMLKLVFDVDHSISFDRPDFKAPKGPHCAGCMPCENPESLHRVYWAPGINAIVVEIAYQGTDTCWEPGNQLHVLTW